MSESYPSHMLAIVGASCRFPGPAFTLQEFFSLLHNGIDAVSTIPEDRFSLERFFSKSRSLVGHAYTSSAGIIPNLLDFDPHFFGISITEALTMDPQQRLILEMVWEAMENAGIVPSSLRGVEAGVYIGAASNDVSLRNADDVVSSTPYSMTGCNLGVIANRVSYLYDLHGPSCSIDTACSSSLVALHIACEALRNGEIPLAIVGGINCLFTPYGFGGFSKAQMLSPDGRCKAFDADGNGYVRSEGGGVTLITTLEHARKQGWEPLALIAGSGINSDGRTTGISLPNPKAQAKLIENVYKRFNIDKQNLVYVEAHGTGTAAGDPLEASAIGETLGRPLLHTRKLPVGSVKSNIGHLETSSGMAGLIKALLILQNKEIPPNLHFNTPNPAIDFEKENIFIPTKATPLAEADGKALIGINSFGFGGTNAHVVLQQPPQVHKKAVSTKKSVSSDTAYPPLFVSAKSPESLQSMMVALSEQTQALAEEDCYRLAYNLAFKREHLERRVIIKGNSKEKLANNLHQASQKESLGSISVVPAPNAPKAGGVFVFNGNGSQWVGMGHELYAHNALFRQTITTIDTLLKRYQTWSIIDIISAPDEHPDAFNHTETSQPLIFAIQVAIVEVLASKGIRPSAVAGHSVGEVAAAWCAGALSLEDATTVIYARSILQAPLRGKGVMGVANISASRAQEMLEPFNNAVEIAAINTNSSITLSGDEEALHAIVSQCKKQRIAAKVLDIPYPYHTHAMDCIKDQLDVLLKDIHPKTPKLLFYSTVEGKKKQPFRANAGYWMDNIRKPVLFASALQDAYDDGYRHFLEIGPKAILRSYMREIFQDAQEQVYFAASINTPANESESLEDAWEKAWLHGWDILWDSLFPHPAASIPLPTYKWNKEHCWHAPSSESRNYLTQKRIHPLLGWQLPCKANVYENTINTTDFSWLQDHMVGNSVIYPAAAFIESMLAAGRQVFPDQPTALERVALFSPLTFIQDKAKVVKISVDTEDGGIVLESKTYGNQENWNKNAKGRIYPFAQEGFTCLFPVENPASFGHAIPREKIYETAEQCQLYYGEAFQAVTQAWLGGTQQHPEALVELHSTENDSHKGMYIPPTLMDSAFHPLFLLLQASGYTGQTYLPAAFDRVLLIDSGIPRYAHVRLEKISTRSIVASFYLFDENRTPLLAMEECRFRRAGWVEQRIPASLPYVTTLYATPHPQQFSLPAFLEETHVENSFRTVTRAMDTAIGQNVSQGWRLLLMASQATAHEAMLKLSKPVDTTQTTLSCADLLLQGTIAQDGQAWLNYTMELLERAELAQKEDEAWLLHLNKAQHSSKLLWRTTLAASPEMACELALLGHIADIHSQAIAHSLAESKVLPESLLRAYYANGYSLKPIIETAQNLLINLIKKSAPGEEFKILFIGKEPESFISPLQPHLELGRCQLTIATASESDAEAGRLNFALSPCLRFTHLDITDADSLPDETFHLVVCNWEMHEHISTQFFLEQCKTLLERGGLFLMTELSPNVFNDFTLGAHSEWWQASMDAEHPISLLRPCHEWQSELEKASFSQIKTYETDATSAVLLLGRAPYEAPSSVLEEHISSEQDEAEQDKTTTRWVLVCQEMGTPSALLANKLATSLAQTLTEPEPHITVLHKGDTYTDILFDPCQAEHWGIVATPHDKREKVRIIYLAGYETATALTGEALLTQQTESLMGLTALTQALAGTTPKNIALSVIGGGGSAPLTHGRHVPSQGSLLGFTRVLQNEVRFGFVDFLDIQVADPQTILPELVRELLHPTQEREVIFADKQRYISRLREYVQPTNSTSAEQEVQLTFTQPGRLQNLHWQHTHLSLPADNEVRVKVKYTGLNFRDVMWAMGLLPDEALENGFSGAGLGIECSGTIDAIGEGVTDWNIGDEVLCFAPACFGSHVITSVNAVAKKPVTMSFAHAATIPVTFITAWYSIHYLARLRPGQRILIHGAAGGVGLAAIQIAAHLGLEVYATAGAAEKHNFLKQLGVTRLYSSRSLAFADEIMRDTNGEGVDCVLNSLSGEAIAVGLKIIRPFGHFIELGKRDFFADSPMRLRPFSNNISYYGVDVDQLLIHRPELARDLFAELMDLFAERKLMPLPHTQYNSTQVIDAFQAMQQSTHIGKLVVNVAGAEEIAKQLPVPPVTWQAKKEASYLITGGNGGLGLATASMLAKGGARHILLLSRRGIVGEHEKEQVAALRADGVNVVDIQVDVTDKQALTTTLKAELAEVPPLHGVIHAAAVLDDGLITSLTTEQIETSLNAKAIGAWNMHEATLDYPLDFFVLFSSATTQFGNPGQAGYVAANAMLESLGALRRDMGLKAQVIGWGPIDDVGMLTRNERARETLLKRLGIAPTSSQSAMSWLEQCIALDIADTAYFGLNWQGKIDNLPFLQSSRFEFLCSTGGGGSSDESINLEAIRTASPQEGTKMVAALLTHEIASILRIPMEKVSVHGPLIELGMDSLMAVELALAIETKFDLTGYTMPLTDKTTVLTLASSLYQVIQGNQEQTDFVEQITQKHGVHLSHTDKETIQNNMAENNNAK